LPEDDALLNADAIRLQQPGAFGSDFSCQIEQISYWMADRLGLPSLNRRSVNVFYNGSRRRLTYDSKYCK